MNEACNAKENPNPRKAEEIAKLILSESVSDQNEIFERLRMILIDERKKYIEKLQSDASNLSDQISYAGNSMEKILIGAIK
jgi:hypothetical protein